MEKKLNIALLLGGTSPEKQVSKSTSKSIYNALVSLGHSVKLINPAYGLNQPSEINDFFKEEEYTEISNANYIEVFNSDLLKDIELVFIGLHGRWGEDGTIQSLLELKGIKYTGSNVLSSALSMDKTMSKINFRHYDITTADWFTVDKNNVDVDSIKLKIETEFGYPCVMKPNDQGSTVGLTICKNEDDVEKGLALSFQFSEKTVVEKYIAGREVTVAVIEGSPLPVLEIKPQHGLYDYECKYTSGMSIYEVPAQLSEDVALKLQQQALAAFNSLGCKTYARVDFRLAEDNTPYCLEVNTLPGMTSTSLVPKMAKAVGISFEELIDKIIRLSL